jgi:hypothetical protein
VKKTVEILVTQMKKLNATDAHFTLENIHETQNLTAVVSIYDKLKPDHMVVAELVAWSEENDPELEKRIQAIRNDMSWNPKL